MFEDDGTKMAPASSVVVDSERKLMFLHGKFQNPYTVLNSVLSTYRAYGSAFACLQAINSK